MPKDRQNQHDEEDVRRPSEERPLLGNGRPFPAAVVPSRPFQRKVEFFAIFFLVVIQLGSGVQGPAVNQILERIICEKLHPDVVLSAGGGSDDVCKSTDVQDQLAKLNGWISAFECIPSLVSTIPYGIIADKYGRRPVLFFSMFGVWLYTIWCLLPLLLPGTFPLWTLPLGIIFMFIGGGPSMISAMIWCLISDAVPVEERTAVFYRIGAASMVMGLIINPLAATLLRINPWVPLGFGDVMMFAGTLIALMVPETLDIRRAMDERIEQHIQQEANGAITREADSADGGSDARKRRNILGRTIDTMKNDMAHVWRFLIGSKGLALLILSLALNMSLIRFAFTSLVTQYIHKRYNLDWSDATYILTMEPAINLVLMLTVLPLINWYTSRKGVSAVKRDLWVARVLSITAVVGCFLVGFSFTLPQFIFSLFILSLSAPFSIVVRSVANAVVEPHTVGILNTTIAFIETSGVLVAAPFLSWLFGRGLKAGGAWVGLPYMVATILAAFGTLLIMLFRAPRRP